MHPRLLERAFSAQVQILIDRGDPGEPQADNSTDRVPVLPDKSEEFNQHDNAIGLPNDRRLTLIHTSRKHLYLVVVGVVPQILHSLVVRTGIRFNCYQFFVD
jgi:hypothetical protein